MNSTKTIDIRSHSFQDGERMFWDANILLAVYGPVSMWTHQYRDYSTALRNTLNQGSRIYVDILVLAEFVNKFVQSECSRLGMQSGGREFKQVRATANYKNIVAEVVQVVRNIARQFVRIDSGLPPMDLGSRLADFEAGRCGFNDQIIIEICQQNDLELVTHDSDFGNSGLTILTANPDLLQL